MASFLHINDQVDRKLIFDTTPRRIVSLVPSITYLLSQFGLDEEVVGLTRFCKFPSDWKKRKTIVGGTKDFKTGRIAALQPDLILANKEENTKEAVLALENIAPVYVSDVFDLESNNQFISDVGRILNKENEANSFISGIQKKRKEYKIDILSHLDAAYMIWQDPYMSVGGDTFIHKMMKYAGFHNIFSDLNRYPVVTIDDIKKRKPALILLSSEPYPFKEKHLLPWQNLFPETCILLVEGEPFTWFGAYPLKAFDYFTQLKEKIQLCIQNKRN